MCAMCLRVCCEDDTYIHEHNTCIVVLVSLLIYRSLSFQSFSLSRLVPHSQKCQGIDRCDEDVCLCVCSINLSVILFSIMLSLLLLSLSLPLAFYYSPKGAEVGIGVMCAMSLRVCERVRRRYIHT